MSDQKITIEKGTVQETLLIPLYGRKICNEVFPDLYHDPYAEELIGTGSTMTFLQWNNKRTACFISLAHWKPLCVN